MQPYGRGAPPSNGFFRKLVGGAARRRAADVTERVFGSITDAERRTLMLPLSWKDDAFNERAKMRADIAGTSAVGCLERVLRHHAAFGTPMAHHHVSGSEDLAASIADERQRDDSEVSESDMIGSQSDASMASNPISDSATPDAITDAVAEGPSPSSASPPLPPLSPTVVASSVSAAVLYEYPRANADLFEVMYDRKVRKGTGRHRRNVAVRTHPVDDACAFAFTTLTATAALHRLDIVHGDIKPENVVAIQDSPTTLELRLCDLDSCRLPEDTSETLTSFDAAVRAASRGQLPFFLATAGLVSREAASEILRNQSLRNACCARCPSSGPEADEDDEHEDKETSHTHFVHTVMSPESEWKMLYAINSYIPTKSNDVYMIGTTIISIITGHMLANDSNIKKSLETLHKLAVGVYDHESLGWNKVRSYERVETFARAYPEVRPLLDLAFQMIDVNPDKRPTSSEALSALLKIVPDATNRIHVRFHD